MPTQIDRHLLGDRSHHHQIFPHLCPSGACWNLSQGGLPRSTKEILNACIRMLSSPALTTSHVAACKHLKIERNGEQLPS